MKVSQSDLAKRRQIFSEFIYYIFDSLLIPLIRSNFYVTETNIHRNRVFYFRHDVWWSLSEPAFAHLKGSMLEEMGGAKATRALERRTLGFSQIRLLPKASGFRSITNLRRRVVKRQNGRVIMGRSINALLTPVYNMLNYEKASPNVTLRLSPLTLIDRDNNQTNWDLLSSRLGKCILN